MSVFIHWEKEDKKNKQSVCSDIQNCIFHLFFSAFLPASQGDVRFNKPILSSCQKWNKSQETHPVCLHIKAPRTLLCNCNVIQQQREEYFLPQREFSILHQWHTWQCSGFLENLEQWAVLQITTHNLPNLQCFAIKMQLCGHTNM